MRGGLGILPGWDLVLMIPEGFGGLGDGGLGVFENGMGLFIVAELGITGGQFVVSVDECVVEEDGAVEVFFCLCGLADLEKE